MKIFISGGTGFIGSYFVRRMLELGHQIKVLDLYPFESELVESNQKNLDFFQADIRDPIALSDAMKGCDAVLHLAAAHHDFGIADDTFEDVNVRGSKMICDAMIQNGITDVCFFSSVAVYGDVSSVDERVIPDPVSQYGKTKLSAEKVFEKWATESLGRHCLVIRPTVTFGPGNFANMFTLIQQIDKGMFLPVGDGTNIKSLSYVENIIDATLSAWFNTIVEPRAFVAYNYVCKPDLTSGQIAKIIYDALGKKPPRLFVPYLVARILALPFDLVIALTGKNLPISGDRIRKLAKTQTHYESDAIRSAGFKQRVPLRDGIETMVRWYLHSGKDENKKGVKRRLPPAKPKILA